VLANNAIQNNTGALRDILVIYSPTSCYHAPRTCTFHGCVPGRYYRACLLAWHQAAFTDFASRSSSSTILTTLSLARVLITEGNPLECLSALPLLHTLSIADCDDGNRDGGEPTHILITDTLLGHLAWTADPLECVIPHLHSLTASSFLRFDPANYAAFIRSRLIPG
jgi:hypothetical protein